LSTKDGLKRSLRGVVFFIDRCSGKAVSAVFENHSLKFELHDDHFSQTTPDVEWIRECGARRWVILSSDRTIHKNLIERAAILRAKVGSFFFSSADWNTAEKIAILTKALPKMAYLITKRKRPFIAIISKNGSLELLIDYGGKEVKQKMKRRVK
jgi:hypothetical protein